MSDQKVQKQQYLRDEIMDKGYDTQTFLQHISEQKEGGQNLEIWDFEELKKVVAKFCQQNEPVCIIGIDQNDDGEYQEDEDNVSDDAEYEMDNQIVVQANQYYNNNNSEEVDYYEQKYTQKLNAKFEEEELSDAQKQELRKKESILQGVTMGQEIIQQDKDQQGYPQEEEKEEQKCQKGTEDNKGDKIKEFQQVKMPRYNAIEDPYESVIKCDQHISKIAIYQKIKIIINDPVKQSGGGLLKMSTYYSFKITTKPYNWEVRRKMKDFVQLRAVLVKLFPSKIIPPLDVDGTEQSTRTINKRIKYLSSFLNDLKRMPEVWSNQYVVDFMSMKEMEKDQGKFEKIMKNSEKEKEITKIKDMTNMTGSFKSKFTNSTQVYKEESLKFLNTAENSYKELHLLSKQLKKDFEKISSTLSNIGVVYHELFGNFNEFDSLIAEGKDSNVKLKDSYVSFNNILMSWSKSMQQCSTQISDKMTHFFKYSNNEIQSFKELHKKSMEVDKNYFKYKQSLMEKKEKTFKLDISKWEVDKQFLQEAQQAKDNKKLAFDLMFTKETTYQRYLKEQMSFWTNNTRLECSYGFRKKADDYFDFFKAFAKAETNIINELLGSWGKITQDYGFDNPFPMPREIAPGRFSLNMEDNNVIPPQ